MTLKRTKQSVKSKKKGISVAARKAKGRELQKWLCAKISELTGYEWGKDKDIESRGMGQSGMDVRMSPAVIEKFPYSPECKRQEGMAIYSWIEQAKNNQVEGTDWLLVLRQSRDVPIIVIDAESFFRILRQCKKLKEKVTTLRKEK